MDRTQGQSGLDAQAPGGSATPSAVSASASAAGPASPGAAQAPSGPAGPARVVTLTAGDFTLTVNPVDGSEIEPLRPGTERGRPAKRDAAARAVRDAAARPPVLPGPPISARPLLARGEELERLVRLLGRGRSVRLTGPSGSGRSALLDAVVARCAGLAPDGVVRLSGHGHQQPGELLHTLYATVYDAPRERPERDELLARVRDIGAVVLLDDLEMGGSALDELLRATPECAYLLAATPDTKAPSDDSHVEEVFLTGLGKDDCAALLETGLGRPLTDEETAWAGDLRFASEGLPLRFVQAAAMLRQRDELNHSDADDDEEEPGVFEERPRDSGVVPLPTLAEGAAPAELLASRVSESARATLRIACALGGELPHHAHLPALVGDTHADTAVAELLDCGLLTPVGTRYRLAAGVARQLEDVGYGDTASEEARTAARHYAWWTGHASVVPERVAAEADAVLAALAGADVVAAAVLARTAAPAFAASLHWEAWERVLRSGAEAARKAGEVAEQAYFHHELGVLALCEGRVDRARAELETSIGLRGALADKRGTVAGRRALALVVDREAAGAASPPLRLEAPAASAEAVTVATPAKPAAPAGPATPATPAARTDAVTKAVPAAKPAPVLRAGAAAAPRVDPAVSEAAVTRAAPLTPKVPVSAEAVTRMTPVVPVTQRSETPTTLSAVFEDAFPLAPQPAPPAAPAPATVPAEPAQGQGRRRRVLLAAAGALTVVALGTVVSLAMSSSDTEPPADGPAASSTPTPAAPTTVQQNSGNDPAEEPPVTAPSEGGATPGASAAAPSPGRTPGRTPSRRPSSTPGNSSGPGTPSTAPTTAEPTPTVTETGEATPTATAPTGPGTATATSPTTAP